ncbi:DUF4245 domain-containing protein [Streptomyces antnestii]|uniref:DUF4245 domain-containing protein n=1 Tax=Streptomyces antnestii TaxID=2494256 RepID=A0A3S2VA77_9ACTN|nr:DUF4245 domain-containing protein [Streptomyces sp. San01]RVU19569.1 DUF4245 domain-containing protein [Streptomyces sp. San01]
MAGTKGKKTVGSLVLSMGATVLAAGCIYMFVPHDESGDPPVKRVDYRVELLTARRAAAYPVAAPEGLTKSWKPTSVRYDGSNFDTWHLGFHDPEGQYVGIEQSTEKPVTFIDRASQGATATSATQRIGGETWRRYKGGEYDYKALVLKGDKSTTVVTGTASFAQLTKMAEALRTK